MLLLALLAILLLPACITTDPPSGEDENATDSQSQIDRDTATDTRGPETLGSAERAAREPEDLFELTREQAELASGLLTDALGSADKGTVSLALDLLARLDPRQAALFRQPVTELANASEQTDRFTLGAWLAADPVQSEEHIADLLAAGEAAAFMALVHHDAAGRRLLAQLDIDPGDSTIAGLCLDLIRSWGGAKAGDAGLLRQLTESDDLTVAYRACGHLLAIDAGGEEETGRLESAVREGGDGWVGAVEGVKISGDPLFAELLIPYVSQVQLAETEEDAGPGGEPEAISESAEVLLAAYSLAYLPGEQAAFMRDRLCRAKSPDVRWQALLGELLNGSSTGWHAAITERGAEEPQLWIVLAAPEARHAQLLPLYAAASCSGDQLLRGSAALQLNRYNGIASESRLARILIRLASDESPAIREQALITSGDLRLAGVARHVVDRLRDDSTGPGERLAVSYCVLAGGVLRTEPAEADIRGSDG